MWTLETRDSRTAKPIIFRILSGGSKIIGRGPLANFVLVAPLVSRFHCRLTATDERLEVEDLGSTNGTFVNGRPVARATLAPGDRLRVGGIELVVTTDELA